MTPEQFTAITERLDKIVALLEIQTFGEEPECAHETAIDQGIYGDVPGRRMWCPNCKKTFSRIVEV
jgi:hypothetical protein